MDERWIEQLEEFVKERDNVENDIYKEDFVDLLLEDDELSFEEAAFMMGYVS
ncbi:hypothetical protein K9M74_04620 [Candidatus Woesearchaeota archaeon]|nr:hypothetical protein [Candidatus Woesearchaeota archaeon]